MGLSNVERMLQLADNVFASRVDPEQLDVNPDIIQQLMVLHPSTVSEFDDGQGPVAWVLVIPTTKELMTRFLDGQISEKQLFQLTPAGATYEAIYLCSALVLEEYRRMGISRKLTCNAINRIREHHPIQSLFVWPFSPEGEQCAEQIANEVSLPLSKHQHASH